MEVSAKTLREVEFREKMRGYHPEDVDHFLEEVAAGIEVLQDRLRQTTERAQRAEAAANEAGSTDDTLRRTLVLAQRTADLAVQEARDQAGRILASAEQQAQSIVGEAEERSRRMMEDSLADSKSELIRLEALRSQGQQEVDGLQRWVDEHKAHLQATLADAMAAIDRAGVMWPAPSSRSIDSSGSGGPGRFADEPPAKAEVDPGPETGIWTPTDEERLDLRQDPGPRQSPDPRQQGNPRQQADPRQSGDPRQQADPRQQSDAPPVPPRQDPGPRQQVDPRQQPDPRQQVDPSPVAADPSSPPVAADNPGELQPEPGDQALDDFFDDNGAYAQDKRLGGRLRRRR